MSTHRISRIRQLNDMLRSLPVPPFGELVITRGGAGLDQDDLAVVLDKVCRFGDFTPTTILMASMILEPLSTLVSKTSGRSTTMICKSSTTRQIRPTQPSPAGC
ncbi:Hypothetical protein NGAL_HAMBI2605_53910 [Neorhizobium galegae bv. orientalis]|nr:Hypothetical protein NGAL_HAMBI2605_53910 [Neorhizobium galegae bv. orientalis]